MVDVAGLGVVDEALQGDMFRLLQRLRNCNLSSEEKSFIEGRLTGTIKIKRGPKMSCTNKQRDQEILITDAWLRYIKDFRKKEARVHELAKHTLISQTQVRTILNTRPTLNTTLIIQHYKNMRLLVRSQIIDKDSLIQPPTI